jgi:hypothetical protein
MPRQITISDADFQLLASWASVCRTLTESIRLLERCTENHPAEHENVDTVGENIEELVTLRQALDNVNAACKAVRNN